MKLRLFPSLLLLALCACGSREEGVQLHLRLALRPARHALSENAIRSFTNDRGEHITLSRAYVTLNSVEIFPCPTTSAWRWLRLLSPIGTAEAHEVSTPRRLGVTHVTGLERSDGEVVAVGTLQPPPGGYCRARIVFSPADADAEGLPAGASMEGKTLLLEGEVVPAGGGAARPFRVESQGFSSAEVSLEGLSLTPDTPEASRTVHLAYDKWLDGVDPTSAGITAPVLKNLASSTTIGP